MIDGQHDRFKDAPWYNRTSRTNVVVGGAGGIGSWLVLFLARTGTKITVYDHDSFELHNMGGQFVDHAHVGTSKVDSLTDLVNEFSDETITGLEEKFMTTSMNSMIMFSGFDNMEARKIMFNRWKGGLSNHTSHYGRSLNTNRLFIDGRLLMEQMQIFCVKGDDKDSIKEYETKHLFDDSEVETESCTLKQTSHSAAMIAAMMTGFYTNHLSNIHLQKDVRSVPFYTEYFIPLNLFQS